MKMKSNKGPFTASESRWKAKFFYDLSQHGSQSTLSRLYRTKRKREPKGERSKNNQKRSKNRVLTIRKSHKLPAKINTIVHNGWEVNPARN